MSTPVGQKKVNEKEELPSLSIINESDTDLWDVVVTVTGQKFFCDKKHLARHSSFFSSLFLGNMKEAKQGKAVLQKATAEEFKDFLAVIYGERSPSDDNVESLMRLADMWDAPHVRNKCEDMLVNNSRLEVTRKVEIACKFNREELKTTLIAQIATFDELRKFSTNQRTPYDHETMTMLFEKSLALESSPPLRPTLEPFYCRLKSYNGNN